MVVLGVPVAGSVPLTILVVLLLVLVRVWHLLISVEIVSILVVELREALFTEQFRPGLVVVAVVLVGLEEIVVVLVLGETFANLLLLLCSALLCCFLFVFVRPEFVIVFVAESFACMDGVTAKDKPIILLALGKFTQYAVGFTDV